MARRRYSEEREARRFGVILAILLGALGGYSLWRDHPGRAGVLAALAAAALLLSFAVSPLWLRFFRAWMKLAEGLSWVSTRVILAVFFYLILTPVGLVMKGLGRAPMDLAWRDGKPSYWVDKAPVEATLERYRKQY